MIISIDFDYLSSNTSLLVQVLTDYTSTTLDLAQDTKTLLLEFDMPIKNQIVNLRFCCNDLRIMHHPLTITNILLDNFYQSVSILYRGHPKFDQTFLTIAKQKNMCLDTTVNDSNRLDFTGELVYKFIWPFYKNAYVVA